MLQRRLGLYLSAAKTANDALAASRDERDRRLVDYLGDLACNSGEHSTRHHAINRAWRDACADEQVDLKMASSRKQPTSCLRLGVLSFRVNHLHFTL